MKRLVAFFALFGSMTTLVCCALPAALVALGLGGVFAGLMGAFPQLSWLSVHKGLVFGIAGLMLAAGGVLQWNARHEPCPIDPVQAQACKSARRWSLLVYWVALVLYALGATFAFVLPALQR